MNRIEAENKLKKIFGLEKFYDKQWETINKIFQGKRVLLIEKTGFGKSLCYQFPATQFGGTTVIFPPLIALMRDQVKKLNSLGINAKCINNEQSLEENRKIIEEIKQGEIKILYIAPERQENYEWIEATRQFKLLSMVVVDEAHCISVWGHDFRPAFRRIINLVNLLPLSFPVLATTATATKRVEEDILKQMGENVIPIRGNLLRENLYLKVTKVNSEDEKLSLIVDILRKINGTGIIFTGTRANTEIYTRWLKYWGISAESYHAGLGGVSRKDIEEGWLNNRWKCVVSTNVLGMGVDNPNIRFIIHTQIPASLIHYYQEIGRAGRDGKLAYIILFYNQKDIELQEHFIENSKPSIEKYQRVIKTLKKEPLGEYQLMRETNLTQTQVRIIKSDLIEQGIIKEVHYGNQKKYEYQFNAPPLDTKVFEQLRKIKFEELFKIIQYVNSDKCRMKFLCDYLGNTLLNICDRCDNDLKKSYKIEFTKKEPSQEMIKKIEEFRENYFPVLKVESKNTNLMNGISSSYYGFSNIGEIIHKCKYENGGDFPDFLLKLTLKAFRKHFGNENFDLIVYVPPTESGNLVKNFAEKISTILKIPISHNLKKQRETKLQKAFQNHLLKSDNVLNAFTYTKPEEVKNKTILLIDDVFDSGIIIKEIGKLFTKLGTTKIAPLTIAKTMKRW